MTGPVFLGSQQVCRSAHAEKTATALTIYLGVCERDNRPVRFSVPLRTGDLDDLAARAGIAWQAVRATPPGRPSPLAALPSAPPQGAAS